MSVFGWGSPYGTSRNIVGKVEEGVGRSTGDVKTQIQGKLDEAAGARPGPLQSDGGRRTRYGCEPRQMATHDNRDPALYNGNRGARLAPRQDAQAAPIAPAAQLGAGYRSRCARAPR
jgi:hypothetical protein